jgi:hypothetical protein
MCVDIMSGFITLKRCIIIKALLLLAVAAAAFPASLCRAADTDAEIRHLQDFIGDSECRFVRNGVEYDSADALKHIRRKYKAARRHIETAEDFIRLAATRSSMSGDPYLVRCGGREVPCSDWLHEELSRYREKPRAVFPGP